TEFPSGTNPDRPNFVQRNRIVAGMTDATLVIESATKGGSLITAELAQSYGRDCFAFPGRVGDVQSEGCNRLIASNAAQLLTSAKDFALAMGWELPSKNLSDAAVQGELFDDLTPDEQQIVSLLTARGDLQLNILVAEINLPVYRLSAILLDLEMKGVVKPLQGAMYHLLRH
ncbi:MAG: DNA-processing protein DprA, partial [Bacteroidaceae bacterium]|nr:DNA-processing protein DprA [Bacteroidaceae bacterium]